jgi:hypothetical protein
MQVAGDQFRRVLRFDISSFCNAAICGVANPNHDLILALAVALP